MKKLITFLTISVLCAAFTNVQGQALSMTLKSEKLIGERPIIRLTGFTNTTIQIDWGDGVKRDHTVSNTWGTVTNIGYTLTVDSPTIKVYGQFQSILAFDMGLTSMEFHGTQWNRLRRLDCYNNQLTSLVFPAGAGFSTYLGTVTAYNNNFDVCAVEALYNSIFDRTGQTVAGRLIISGGNSITDSQSLAVEEQSKISLANNRNWTVVRKGPPDIDLTQSPTALGCISTGFNSIAYNNSVFCYYDALNANLIVKNTSEKKGNLIIYDAIGKVRLMESISSGETPVNISRFPKGIYIVNLNNSINKIILN